jgi:phosphatidylserine/phosphatidylglycerophosphate/cardiolipin synthase-like enzyme
MASDYLCAKRLENMEKYIAACIQSDYPDLIFLETFQPLATYTLRQRLTEFEIDIISPWIKRSAWESIKIPIIKFAKKGGALKVFFKGDECDFSSGLCDDIRKDVDDMGGEIILIKQLHAKLYIIDRKEAILASSNLTRGGVEGNLEREFGPITHL